MKLIHIVGRQKNGKTTLIVELVKEMTRRGIRVGTLKHSSHVHELDKPGKDSFLHRQAGGIPAAIATLDQIAVYLPKKPDENPFDQLATLYKDVDLVLIEGYISGPWKKVEVWRSEISPLPLHTEKKNIDAVITDDPIETTLPVWPRKNISVLTDKILAFAEIHCNAEPPFVP